MAVIVRDARQARLDGRRVETDEFDRIPGPGGFPRNQAILGPRDSGSPDRRDTIGHTGAMKGLADRPLILAPGPNREYPTIMGRPDDGHTKAPREPTFRRL